jgi:inosine-uridine nucleoside N-ribohydrolase
MANSKNSRKINMGDETIATLQSAEFDYLMDSEAAKVVLAENSVGLDY